METGKKAVSQSKYLQALGLWTCAKQRVLEGAKFERELHRLLGLESGGHLSDAIFGDDEPATVEIFNAALKQAGITVGDD